MGKPSFPSRRWLRTLTFTAGLFLMSGLIVGNLPGQNKNNKKPAKDKDVRIIDIMVGGAGVEQVAYINAAIEKAWKDNKIEPSERCTDFEFIRRASLDIIGRIATVREVQQFLNDPPRERRSRLIERLLNSPDYATNWGNIWTVLLLTRSGVAKVYQDQMREWLEEKLTDSKDYAPAWDKIVTEILTATGKTNDNRAVNFVLAHLGEPVKGQDGVFDMVPVTSRTTKLFLGTRTQCVQCHDHPFNDETLGQHHFWGINAFFRQVTAPQGRPGMVKNKMAKVKFTQQFGVEDNPNVNPRGLVSYERRTGLLAMTDSTFLDGRKIKNKKLSRREALAQFVTKSPMFAKAYVNRMWGHFFGKSFTKDAVDDFQHENPPSHPELLDRLADDWAKKYHHNPKDMIRWIGNSRAYGLSSVANKTNDNPDHESFFPRMLLKAMTPEQLFDSVMTATQAKVSQQKAAKLALREAWLAKLIQNFGDDEGNETTYSGTVVQALLLMNGQDINTFIMDKDIGTVALVLKKRAFSRNAAREAMKDLYLAALNRPPTEAEYTKILNFKMILLPRVNTKSQQGEAFWTGFYQDLFWAVLNSNEFILNH